MHHHRCTSPFLLLLTVAGLLSGACSRQNPEQENGEIQFRMDEGWQEAVSKAVVFEGGSITSGSFGVSAYRQGSATAYFSSQEVNYVEASSSWEFAAGKQYWPASGALDFHAWMPYETPAYISNSGYAPGVPGFDAALPLTMAGQEGVTEYMYAYVGGRSRADGAVTLSFRRPFAVVRLQLAQSYPGITIGSVTFKDVASGGSYTHGSGWSNEGNRGDMVFAFDVEFADGDGVVPIGSPMLAIPQSIGTQEVVVTYTWNGSTQLTMNATVSVPAWEAGKRYTYTLSLAGDVWEGEGGGIEWMMDDFTASGETLEWMPDSPTGILPGLFSVSSDKQVYFSRGNLQFTRTSVNVDWSTGKYSFLDNQYTTVEEDTPDEEDYEDYSSSNVITLFGWGTGLNPVQIGSDADYRTFNDWGAAAEASIGDNWRTLTKDEWVYVINVNNSNSYRQVTVDDEKKAPYGLGTVNGVNGMIILPDNWDGSVHANFKYGKSAWLNDYTEASSPKWSEMEAAGCVFLPAAGGRSYDDKVSAVGGNGYYWSSTGYSDDIDDEIVGSYYLYFNEYFVFADGGTNRYEGYSVRLVYDPQ